MWLDILKQMKKEAKKTSQKISDETGIPKSTIDKLFIGRTKDPSLSQIRAIVHCLGYTLDDLDDSNKNLDNNKKIALTENEDEQKKQLLHNYDKMNETAQNTLVKYSEFMASQPENLKIKADNNKMNA